MYTFLFQGYNSRNESASDCEGQDKYVLLLLTFAGNVQFFAGLASLCSKKAVTLPTEKQYNSKLPSERQFHFRTKKVISYD